jgi:hypothetical protein
MSYNYLSCDLESLRCGLSERVCNAIGTLITIALAVAGISCLVVGLVCFNSGGWVSNKTQCESIYITGILSSFVIGVVFVFGLLFYLVERCDRPPTARPVRRRLESNHEVSGASKRSRASPKLSGHSLRGPKLSAKKKNSPLQVLVV